MNPLRISKAPTQPPGPPEPFRGSQPDPDQIRMGGGEKTIASDLFVRLEDGSRIAHAFTIPQ